MGREFGERKAMLCHRAEQFVAVRLALRGALKIEQASVPARNLYALVAQRSRPAADLVQCVEWGTVSGELRQKDTRSINRLHACPCYLVCVACSRRMRQIIAVAPRAA